MKKAFEEEEMLKGHYYGKFLGTFFMTAIDKFIEGVVVRIAQQLIKWPTSINEEGVRRRVRRRKSKKNPDETLLMRQNNQTTETKMSNSSLNRN